MKKLLTTFFVLFLALTVKGQTYQELIEQYKGKPGVECTDIGKDMLALVVAATANNTDGDSKEMVSLLKRLDHLTIMSISDFDDAFLQEFIKKAKALEKTYEKMIEQQEDGENTLFLAQRDDNTVKALIAIVYGPKEIEMVAIEGNLQPSDLELFNKIGNM